MSAPTTSSEFSLPRELVAQASRITSREVQQLQTMNRVLVDRLMQVEEELKRLKEGNEDEGRVMRTPSLEISIPDIADPASNDVHLDQIDSIENASQSPTTPSTPRIHVVTPLPEYSPYLPPIDRTLVHEEFYADLQDKRIIPGYDAERWSCWCHVAKSAKGDSGPLSLTHTKPAKNGQPYVFKPARFIAHATRCDFFKDPWATDEDGQWLFPQFPLEKNRPHEGVQGSRLGYPTASVDSNRLDPHSGEAASELSSANVEEAVAPRQATSPRGAIPRYSIPGYSPHLPAIDQGNTGEPFFKHLQETDIISGYDDTRFFCWCHVARDAEKGVDPGSHGKLHSDARVMEGQGQGPRYRVSMFYDHAKICSFYKDPWATKRGTGERWFPQFPLAEPSRTVTTDTPARISTPSPGIAPSIESQSPAITTSTCILVPRYDLPDYSPHLPAIDITKEDEDFYIHLRDAKIIATLGETRFACWCHLAKDDAQGARGRHGKSHSDYRVVDGSEGARYRVSRFFEHARSCAFLRNPWATDRSGRRLFPHFPLPKPEERLEEESTLQSVAERIVRTKRKAPSSTPSRPNAPIPHYSAYLPPIDTSLTGEPFFAHLRNEMIIASYDATRFSCWRHIAKDVEKGMITGSHGKSHAEASVNGKRYTVSMFYEHARRCAFFTDPWATSDDQGVRMYPQFPLEKPARPYASDGMVVTVDSPSSHDGEDVVDGGGRSLRKRKKVRYVDW